MKPTNEAATNASSTTGQRRLSGWRAPTSASARSAASVADRLGVERAGVAAEAHAEARHQVRALAGERRGVGPRLGGRVGGREAARVGERHRALACRSRRRSRPGVTPLRARAARSTSSASSTFRSVDQSANAAEREPVDSASCRSRPAGRRTRPRRRPRRRRAGAPRQLADARVAQVGPVRVARAAVRRRRARRARARRRR